MTGSEMFAQLITLRNEAGAKHYQRVALADKLLKDKGWVEAPDEGGGDENKALIRLEEDCFGDICGLVSLIQLLDLFQHFPRETQWKEHRYDISRMWAAFQSKKKAKARGLDKDKRITHREAQPLLPVTQFVHESLARQRHEYDKAVTRCEGQAEKIARLEQENAELRAENATLKDELKALRAGVRQLVA